jgi:pyruvate,orthophosphate dikinase
VLCRRLRRVSDRLESPKKITSAVTFKEGDWISIDGSTGEVMAGAVAMDRPTLSGDFAKLMSWADEHRTLGCAPTPTPPRTPSTARDFGAEGIGLCRTEHMFFEGERIWAPMREMILAGQRGREGPPRKALAKLLPYQRKDFEGIFTAMEGLPVTIRLLDPPLHEFLPHEAGSPGRDGQAPGRQAVDVVKSRVAQLHEFNPMLGHRGCRLASPTPRSTRCRPAPSSRPPQRRQEEGKRPCPRS